MGADVLSDRALGRATLARQLLLERHTIAPAAAVAHLVGLQAQNPLDPYLALWSRLDAFDPNTVGRLLSDRSLVRIVVMRGTIHLVTADDALVLRPLVQPVLDAEIARHSEYAPLLRDVDMAPVLERARALLTEPHSGPELRAALAASFPDLHAAALAYACRCYLPLVQVPPRGVWGRAGQVTTATLESWVGRPLAPAPSLDDVLRRYLAAFGPATVADATTWTRLTGLRAAFERLRPMLRTFRDERGRELFDVEDGDLPDPDTPAPVRFLPEYDNVLLSHAERSRFAGDLDGHLARAVGPYKGAVLVDGTVHGLWRSEVDRKAGTATVVVEHAPLGKRSATQVEAEAQRVARFWHPAAAAHDVRLLLIA